MTLTFRGNDTPACPGVSRDGGPGLAGARSRLATRPADRAPGLGHALARGRGLPSGRSRSGKGLSAWRPHHRHLPRPRAPHRPGRPPGIPHPDPAQWLEDRNAEPDAGNISAIIEAAGAHPLDGIKATELKRKPGHFRTNAHRMHYARFQKLGMFIGSAAIEGGIKAIVVQRTGQSGMHWTVEGAEDIIALRCQHASGRWNDFITPRPAPAAGLRAAIGQTPRLRPRGHHPGKDHPQRSWRAPHP